MSLIQCVSETEGYFTCTGDWNAYTYGTPMRAGASPHTSSSCLDGEAGHTPTLVKYNLAFITDLLTARGVNATIVANIATAADSYLGGQRALLASAPYYNASIVPDCRACSGRQSTPTWVAPVAALAGLGFMILCIYLLRKPLTKLARKTIAWVRK